MTDDEKRPGALLDITKNVQRPTLNVQLIHSMLDVER